MSYLSRSGLCVALIGSLLSGLAIADDAIQWKLETDSRIPQEVRSLLPVSDASSLEHTVDLLVRIRVKLGASQIIQSVRRVTYFGTPEGVRSDGTTSISLDLGSERLVVHEAAVIQANGDVVRFDPETVQINDVDSYDVFTDQRQVVLQLPGLAAGATLLLDYDRIINRKQLDLPWLDVYYPRTLRPRSLFQLHVAWEGERPAWRNGTPGLTCQEDQRSLSCSAGGLPPVPSDPDVAFRDVLPYFILAEDRSWDDIIEAVLAGVDMALAQDAGLEEIHRELTSGAGTRNARIKRLHEFVTRDVRYVSFSEGRHSVVPHGVDSTLVNRYGDCKDKSTLLLALLRKSGIEAYPVLVATRRHDPRRLALPGSGYFDHMIICMKNDDQGDLCLDATDPFSSWNHTSHAVQGNVRLILAPGEHPGVVPSDRFRWRMEVDSDIVFDEGGGQLESLTLTYPDAYASHLRGSHATQSPDEVQRWALDRYHASVSDKVRPEFVIQGLTGPHEKVVIESTATYGKVVDAGNPLDYVERAAWLVGLLGNFGSQNRHYDYEFPGAHLKSTYSFDLTAAWNMTGRGADLEFSHRYGSMTRTFDTDEPGKLRVHTVLALPRQTIPLDEIESFNRFLEILQRESTMRVTGVPR